MGVPLEGNRGGVGGRPTKPRVAIIGSSSSWVMMGLNVLVNHKASFFIHSLMQSSIGIEGLRVWDSLSLSLWLPVSFCGIGFWVLGLCSMFWFLLFIVCTVILYYIYGKIQLVVMMKRERFVLVRLWEWGVRGERKRGHKCRDSIWVGIFGGQILKGQKLPHFHLQLPLFY